MVLRNTMNDMIQKWVEKVQLGDQDAYENIVNTYKNQIYTLCYRQLGNKSDAEDAAQEAFIKVYIHIHSFNLNLKFSSWIYRIATNVCIDRLRKKKPDIYLDKEIEGSEGVDYYSQIPSSEKTPEDRVLIHETQDQVQNEIGKLPEKYRTAIILKYINNLSLQEICEVMDLPLATVKTRIHRGREELKKRLAYV